MGVSPSNSCVSRFGYVWSLPGWCTDRLADILVRRIYSPPTRSPSGALLSQGWSDPDMGWKSEKMPVNYVPRTCLTCDSVRVEIYMPSGWTDAVMQVQSTHFGSATNKAETLFAHDATLTRHSSSGLIEEVYTRR